MKPVIASAIVIAVAALAAPAFAREPDVEIRHAVARVAVVVEDRTDIAVEIEPGSSGLPAIRVTRDGDNVRIDGGLGRSGFLNRGDGIRNCNSRVENPATPGDGVTVEVRNVGRINVSDAPLIVIRTPRAVNVDASGAVFGSVGRGATSVDLGNGGCGYWNIANADGPVSLSIGGSGDMRAGTSRSLDISIGGSGSVTAGATGGLDVSIGGSGDVVVARIDGPADISIAGSGDVNIRGGTSPELGISIAGSGDVNFGGVAGDVDVSLVGGGDVTVARATGSVSRSIMGGGDVRIGS
ncbi:MAG: GIN domain-containing protein [Brevundimonas sp.]